MVVYAHFSLLVAVPSLPVSSGSLGHLATRLMSFAHHDWDYYGHLKSYDLQVIGSDYEDAGAVDAQQALDLILNSKFELHAFYHSVKKVLEVIPYDDRQEVFTQGGAIAVAVQATTRASLCALAVTGVLHLPVSATAHSLCLNSHQTHTRGCQRCNRQERDPLNF